MTLSSEELFAAWAASQERPLTADEMHWARRAWGARPTITTAEDQASQARTDGGAVGEVLTRHSTHGPVTSAFIYEPFHSLPAGTKLYATPPGNATQAAGAREPLTIDQISALNRKTAWPPLSLRNLGDREWLVLLTVATRAIEAAHGIASPAAELKKD